MSEAAPPTGRQNTSQPQRVGVVVLAAGEGTRMRSSTPKVLHAFAGRSILGHVLAATTDLDPTVTVVVVGHARAQVTAHLADIAPHALAAVQEQQLGTAHAVRTALDEIKDELDTVLVLPGDTPCLTAPTLTALLDLHHEHGAAATLLTSRVADPTGYGRVIRSANGEVDAVVEHKDASAGQRAVDEIATAVYAFAADRLSGALARVDNDNAQGEYYLPDVIGLLRADGDLVLATTAAEDETAGVNDKLQLAHAHRTVNRRLLDAHQRAGARVIDAATTWVDVDVVLAADCEIRPGCTLTAGSTVSAGAVVGPDCDVVATSIGAGARVSRSVLDHVEIGDEVNVGPFAYLRNGASLAERSKAGTFVEIKNSQIGAGTKVPHLSYVGDATVGERSNIGAATIFVNYDGVHKHRSTVGDDVRVGADNTLVAPVQVGDGAYTGAGAVIRHDVPAGAISYNDMGQKIVQDWVARKRGSGDPAGADRHGNTPSEGQS